MKLKIIKQINFSSTLAGVRRGALLILGVAALSLSSPSRAFCLQPPTSLLPEQSTSLKLRISAEAPSFESRERYAAQARDLAEFLETRALPAMTPEAVAVLRATPVWIAAERISCPALPPGHACTVAETEAPDDHRTEYKITVSLEMFLNPDIRRIIAHEIFHVVSHAIDPTKESWTETRQAELGWYREGLAQLFEYRVSGKPNGANMREAIENLDTALMASYDGKALSAESYGHDFLFFFYLWRECGGDELYRKFAFEKVTDPVKQIAEALASGASMRLKPQCRSFAESAFHFELARVMNHAEDGTADENRHLLWPSRFGRNYVLEQTDLATLARLPQFKPWVLAGSWQFPGALPPGVTRTWVHLSLPFRSQSETPKLLDPTWLQVFIRVSEQ